MSHHGKAIRRAFSLVELLVVLGIVAMLTALLLPSLSLARSQANRTRCLSNIRQIGVGIAIYVNDHRTLPPMEPLPEYLPEKRFTPVFFSARRSGLMSLPQNAGFNRFFLTCPEGWASGGDGSWYQEKGLSRDGSAYMDYAYWPGRYAPGQEDDLRSESFKYRLGEKGTKILASDVVTDVGETSTQVTVKVGSGNHGSNHPDSLVHVQMTDGRGGRLSNFNRIRAMGSSVLFSDYHADWFRAERLTQRTSGMCYPPPDQW